MALADLMFANRALVEEVSAHNCAVIVRRRLGGDWEAPKNQYRNAVTEALALSEKRAA
jgi:hypothetical protein